MFLKIVHDQTKIYISVKEIFPNLSSNFDTFKSLLHDLSRTDTIFWCARLNMVLLDPRFDHFTQQQAGLKQFLTSEEIDRVNDFVKKYGGPTSVYIFFRGQLLELIRWVTLYCQDFPDDGTTFENPETRRKFAQAALIAGDIWAKRIFDNRFSVNEGLEIGRKRSLGAIRKSIEATTLAPNLEKILGRSWSLFSDYFPQYYQTFEDDFHSSTGLSLEEFYISLCTIITTFMNPEIGDNGITGGIFNSNFSKESTPFRDVLQKYISLDSQTPDELKNALWQNRQKNLNAEKNVPPFDYRPFREKPIIRTEDGRAIIMDSYFYSEKALVGPLFLVSKYKPNNAKKIFSSFGKAFEHYACDILRRMFPDSGSLLARRLRCNLPVGKKGRTMEIDACLNDITELVVFEMKAVWVRENKILSDNYEGFSEELRRSYGIWNDTLGDRKISGTGQIARMIKVLTSKDWIERNEEFSKVNLIYPILLVHGPLLVAPVFGNFLASEFKEYLEPDAELRTGELMKNQTRVTPLIIMTIEDLENLETSIEHFGLRELLADYSRSCPDRVVSLNNYLAFSNKYKGKIYHNRSIATKGLDILCKTQKEVFPTKT